MPFSRRRVLTCLVAAALLLTGAPVQDAGALGWRPVAYVGVNLEGTIEAISVLTHKPIATLTMPPPPAPYGPSGPSDLLLSKDHRHLYATSQYGYVYVFDTATDQVTGTVSVPGNPWHMSLSPDGRRLYVADESKFTVVVIDTATLAVVATIPVGVLPIDVKLTANGRYAYVTNFGHHTAAAEPGTVSVIDTATETVKTTLGFPSSSATPADVAIAPNGRHAYVSLFNDPYVADIDTATNTIIRYIPVGSRPGFSPENLAVAPFGGRLYVSLGNYSTAPSTVAAVSLRTNTVTGSVPVGGSPGPMAFTIVGFGAQGWVSNRDTGTVSVFSTATNTVTDTIRIGTSSFPEPGPIAIGRVPR